MYQTPRKQKPNLWRSSSRYRTNSSRKRSGSKWPDRKSIAKDCGTWVNDTTAPTMTNHARHQRIEHVFGGGTTSPLNKPYCCT